MPYTSQNTCTYLYVHCTYCDLCAFHIQTCRHLGTYGTYCNKDIWHLLPMTGYPLKGTDLLCTFWYLISLTCICRVHFVVLLKKPACRSCLYFRAGKMSGAVDESCQLLVVAIDINPNQLLFARHPGMVYNNISCHPLVDKLHKFQPVAP